MIVRRIISSRIDLERVNREIGALDLSQRWEVIIREYRRAMTREQQGLLHVWLQEIALYHGETIERIKDYLWALGWWPSELVVINRREIARRKPTMDLTAPECAEVMDRVAQLAAESNIQLTEPDHVREIE